MSSLVKVLIIEDSPAQAAAISALVAEAGYYPSVYTEVLTSMEELLEFEQPNLVLLDLRLLDKDGNPAADGYQLCREIKDSANSVPVVIVTAEEDGDPSEWAILQGADAFVQKPFEADDLRTVMEQVLQSGNQS